MKRWLYRTTSASLVLFLATVLPAIAQNSQQQPTTRPAPNTQTGRPQPGGQGPGTKPNPGGKPGSGGGNANRPPQIQPVPGPVNGRPNPGPGNGKPNPGDGNNRPQPPGTNPPKPNPPKPRPPGTYPPKPNPPTTRPPGIYPPKPNPPRPPAPRPPAHRPPQWGRPPQHRPSYQFRPNDWAYLHRYYLRNLGAINRARRPVFIVGGYFPWGDIQYITPLPPNVYGYLPPPPPGYRMGYYAGYVVVYDPVTYFIVNVVDLLQ